MKPLVLKSEEIPFYPGEWEDPAPGAEGWVTSGAEEKIERLFERMDEERQFGKIILAFAPSLSS